MTQQSDEVRYEKLKQEYEQLKDARIKAESNLEHAEKALKEIQLQARETYGTDDLSELEKQLEEMKRSNREMIDDYEKHVEGIKFDLNKIEQEFVQVQADSANSSA